MSIPFSVFRRDAMHERADLSKVPLYEENLSPRPKMPLLMRIEIVAEANCAVYDVYRTPFDFAGEMR
jgi:hypothetical protein